MLKKEIILVLALCFLAISVSTFSSGSLNEGFSIIGINKVCLEVYGVGRAFQDEGVTEEDIREDVRLDLEKAGLQVLSQQQCSKNANTPYFRIKFNIKEFEDGVYVGSARADLCQWVSLIRNPSVETIASTWHTDWAGSLRESRLSEIKSIVSDMVAPFVSEYREMNFMKDPTERNNLIGSDDVNASTTKRLQDGQFLGEPSSADRDHTGPCGDLRQAVPDFRLFSAVAVDTLDHDTCYAACPAYGGVFKTTDGGKHWTKQQDGLSNVLIRALAIDPLEHETVYAATFGDGVFISPDGGEIWRPLNAGLGNLYVSSLAINPESPNVLYAGTFDGGVYKSLDKGNSWSHMDVGLCNHEVFSICVAPSNPQTIYAGTSKGHLFRSDNGAKEWALLKSPTTDNIHSVATSSVDSNTVYIGARRLFKSNDGGRTWNMIGSDIQNVLDIEGCASSPDTLYVASVNRGCCEPSKSKNGGYDWNQISIKKGVGCEYVWSVGTSVFCPEVAFFVNPRGISRSSDGGATFYSSEFPSSHFDAITIDPEKCDTIYAGCRDLGLFRSDDRGRSWVPLQTGFRGYQVRHIAPVPSSPGELYAAHLKGVLKSVDRGKTWVDISAMAKDDISYYYDVAVDPDQPNIVYLGTSAGLFVSTDRGLSWFPSNFGLPSLPRVFNIAIDPFDSETIYTYASFGGHWGRDKGYKARGIFRSTNGGRTWKHVSGGGSFTDSWIHCITIDPSNSKTVYVGAHDGVFKSGNGGSSWHKINAGLPLYPDIHTTAISSRDSQIVYAGSKDGVYKSMNGGKRWSRASRGLPLSRVQSLAIDPKEPSLIYAGTICGLFKSANAGMNWLAVDTLPRSTTADRKQGKTARHKTDFRSILSIGTRW